MSQRHSGRSAPHLAAAGIEFKGALSYSLHVGCSFSLPSSLCWPLRFGVKFENCKSLQALRTLACRDLHGTLLRPFRKTIFL